MAESQPDIQSLLAALAAQRGANSANPQTPHAFPPGPPSSAQPGPYQAPPPQGAPGYGPPGHPLPAPASSGNVDLSAIRPVNSGTMGFDDAGPRARAFAADKGATPYDRPPVYGFDPRGTDPLYRRSRSRSPARGSYARDNRCGVHGRDHGRDFGRDRSYSPPPRGRPFSPRASNGRVRSPLRGVDDNSETIDIESSLVGLIIGRQGENLRRIEAESSCRVQFLASTDGGPFRQCRISGPRQRRAEVKAAINRIIDDSGMGALNRAQEVLRDTGRGGAAVLRDGEDHTQIMVPDRTVGLIIGRGGETIRDLQERSGCHVNIVGESKSVNGLRPVNLIGSAEAAARAKDLILEIVDSDTRGDGLAPKKIATGGGRGDLPPPQREVGGSGSDKLNDAIYVPSEAVGMIIGKGGETIREMQNMTGCKINVAQSSGPAEVQREIALIGPRDSIARAKMAIYEKVEAVRQKGGAGSAGGGGGGGGRGRGHHDFDRAAFPQANPGTPTNAVPPASASDSSDPYAQYGGYQNYVALWYQSLMYHQQQQGDQGQGTPASGSS